MGEVVLIDGRFEVLNRPDRIDIYDITNLQKGEDGRVRPVGVVPLAQPRTHLEAGRIALYWLRDTKYLENYECLRYLEIFLANQPADAAATARESLHNENHRVSKDDR